MVSSSWKTASGLLRVVPQAHIQANCRHYRGTSSLMWARPLQSGPWGTAPWRGGTSLSTLGLSCRWPVRAGPTMNPRCWTYSGKPPVSTGFKDRAAPPWQGNCWLPGTGTSRRRRPGGFQSGDDPVQILVLHGPHPRHRPVSGPVMMPRRPKAASAASPGGVSSVRTVVQPALRQLRLTTRRLSDG